MDTEQIGAFPALEDETTEDGLAILIKAQMAALGRLLTCTFDLSRAVDAAVKRLRGSQGRLVLVGAGASGRIAVQDGVELWPTYGWPHSRLVYLMAGGQAALVASIEGAEDDEDAGRSEADELSLGADDVVVGLAASGNTPYVSAVLQQARKQGALTVAMVNNAECLLRGDAEITVHLNSGPEVINGSTRLSAATAQKAALNALSTMLMVRLNRTYKNIMVDMAANNIKLSARRIRMLRAIDPSIDEASARELLTRANGSVKVAVVLNAGGSVADAIQRLEKVDGRLASLIHPSG